MPGGGRYLLAGIVLASEIDLDELPRTEEPVDCTFRRVEGLWERASSPLIGAEEPDDWIRVARRGTAYVLDFEGMARFEIDERGSEVLGDGVTDLPEATLKHLLLDHVAPRLLALRGELVLHASAVQGPAGAIAMIGASGWGKSTLATSLARAGKPLLGDDALLLERARAGEPPSVRATYPGVRLWAEDVEAAAGPGAHDRVQPVAHYTGKVRVGMGGRDGLAFVVGSLPLARLYVLADPESAPASRVQITRLSHQDAFVALARHAFVLAPDDAAAQRHLFAHLSDSGVLGRCSLLSFPRTREAVPDLLLAIDEDHARGDA